MKLSDALLWAENQEVKDTNCLITKEPIINRITLHCGHDFEYDALLNNYLNDKKNTLFVKHNCPYCRKKMEGFIPYYEDSHIRIDPSKFKNNTYLTCEYVFKSGKHKNMKCNHCANKYKRGIYCKKHYDDNFHHIILLPPPCSVIIGRTVVSYLKKTIRFSFLCDDWLVFITQCL